MSDPWAGGCLCGQVRFRSEAGPLRVSHCHCGMCRRSSGAGFVTWAAMPTSGFAWSGAEPAWFRSSAEAERGFCLRCGSQLVWRPLRPSAEVIVTAGSLDRAAELGPDVHIYTADRLPWVRQDDGCPEWPGRNPNE